MTPTRLELFSDAVLAVIITIMVLELRAPHSADVEALVPLIPVFLSYILSFIVIGTYWNNHHHLLRAAKHVSSGMMWANLHLLFWLSLIPFFTNWLGENHTESWPTALYATLLLTAGIAYQLLQRVIVTGHGKDSAIAAALGSDLKGKMSAVLYTLAIPLAFVNPLFSDILFGVVALMWIIPDLRLRQV